MSLSDLNVVSTTCNGQCSISQIEKQAAEPCENDGLDYIILSEIEQPGTGRYFSHN